MMTARAHKPARKPATRSGRRELAGDADRGRLGRHPRAPYAGGGYPGFCLGRHPRAPAGVLFLVFGDLEKNAKPGSPVHGSGRGVPHEPPK